MLIWVPMEEHDMRFTKQWNAWFPDALLADKRSFTTVFSSEYGTLDPNEFASPSTTISRLQQLESIIRTISSGSADLKSKKKMQFDVLFANLWFPGLEIVKFFEQSTKEKYGEINIYGFLHGGCYDFFDQTNTLEMTPWANHMEKCIMEVSRRVFVGSMFHRDMITHARNMPEEKFVVTGLPTDVKMIHNLPSKSFKERKNIIFANRPIPEKGFDVVKKIKRKQKDLKLIITHNEKLPKMDYYNLLNKSKIIFAPSHHEMFGMSVVEGMAAGCVPVVREGLAFSDYVPKECMFSTEERMIELLKHPPLLTKGDLYSMVKQYDKDVVLKRILEEIKC